MSSLAVEQSCHLTLENLKGVQDLYDRGLYVQAHELARTFGPLKDWRGTPARLLAGRLAGNLGAPRLANWHFVSAWRQDPTHPDACWYYTRQYLDARGPLVAWKWLKRIGELPDAPSESRSHWLGLHACVLGRLRDFDAAETWLARAEEIGPDRPWICMERAALFALEDRLEEALAAARKSLELRPWYRPGLQEVAFLLLQLERDQEALALLTEATQRLESCGLYAQLAALQQELELYAEARQTLEKFAALAPLLEEEVGQWLAARRSDAAYFCGDLAQAVEWATKAKGPFHEEMAKRLAHPAPGRRRVLLPVGFVRQHHQTCVPATLAALSRFWNMPGEHLEVAAAIAYAGTPHHSERLWAEEHGWLAREFTVTWDSTRTLLDGGIPFTLTTTEPGNSHLQAVIGYDDQRGTLLIRDPSERHQSEFLADAFFERYRSTGPRGMALVPLAEAARLRNLDLPDAHLYDHLYRISRALGIHNRASAAEDCAAMKGLAENHPLTLQAQRSLAVYDQDPTQILACNEKLLALFPDDNHLQLSKVACLRELARQEERLALLKHLCEKKQTDAVCWQQYAQELAADAREHATAIHLLRRAIRINPINAGNYYILARIFWDQRRFAEALELNRFAACLEDKDEQLAQAYFSAARALKRTNEVLRFLEKRFTRFGKKSGQPARTLCWAYLQMERTTEAFAALERALQWRPDDGDLVLYAAEVHSHLGEFEKAEALLATAEGHCQHTQWLRSAAALATNQGQLPRALQLWQQVLEVEPLAQDAHRAVAQLLADTVGSDAARGHLRQACGKYAHNYALTKLYIEWLREEGPPAVEPVVRQLIDIHPADAWARRELALTLGEQGKLDEAFAELEFAESLEPTNVSACAVRARLLTLAGRGSEAKAANRQAIHLSVDFDLAIRELVDACDSLAERREALQFVEQELVRQVMFGEGLLAYRDMALFTLEPPELLESLQRALQARPDLWHAWSAVTRQLIDMRENDEALVLARQAVERFPHVPVLWLDLAQVYRAGKDHEGEIEALLRALQIQPGWGPALRQLAEAYEQDGQVEQARAELERAVARYPLLAANHMALADLLWRHEEKEAALDRIHQTVLLEPALEAAWDRLNDWSRQLDQADMAVESARDLSTRRPGEARSWMMLAKALMFNPPPNGEEANEECLGALDHALALNPRLVEAHDLKAELLTRAGRFAEARQACQPKGWEGRPPLILRGRAAWVEAQQGNLPAAIDLMRAVLEEDRNYYWGWNQLADWQQAGGDFSAYLEAAEQMVRLAPESPMGLAFRGEAKLRLGDRDGAKKDLRRAFKLAPSYALAGMTLFDAYLEDDELKKAQTILKVMKHHIGGNFVLAREVQLLVRQDKKIRATGLLRKLCQANDDATWPLETAARAMREAGWESSVEHKYRSALRGENFNPHVAFLFAENWQPGMPHLEERLAGLDKAITQKPDRFQLHDLKAELLAKAGRFEEALAACQHEAINQLVPLRGRAAWIEAERGHVVEAIRKMRQVVADDPAYFWGWLQLANWYEDTRSPREHLMAAEKLVELSPNEAYVFTHRAQAKVNNGDQAGAKGDFRRAFELNPTHTFPGWRLFDMQLADGELDEAARTLELLREHCTNADLYQGQIRLAITRSDQDKALQVLQDLCLLAEVEEDILKETVLLFGQAGWQGEAEGVLGQALENAAIGDSVPAVWVKLRANRGVWLTPTEQDAFAAKGKAGRLVLVHHAVALGKKQRRSELRHLAQRFHDLFRADVWGWGMIGHAFSSGLDDESTATWMADWADHADAQPWMLINFMLALRGLGRRDEAHHVSLHALTLPHDYTTMFHAIWLAYDEAMAGDLEGTRQRLEMVERNQLDDNHRWVEALVLALQRAYQVPPQERSHVLQTIRQHLAGAAASIKTIDCDRAFLIAYQDCLRRIAHNLDTFSAKLWCWWRTRFPRVPKRKPPDS